MDIKKLKYFIHLSETLNFTKVAEKCFISQSAVSQHISNIEKEVGFLLFNRTKNKVELTEAGKEFLKEASIIVQKYESAVEKSRMIANESNSKLKVAFFESMDLRFLIEVITEFEQSHKEIEIIYEKRDLKQINNLLENDLVDIAFSFPEELKNIENVKVFNICSNEMYLAVSKKNPLSCNEEIKAIDVGKENIIIVSEEYGLMHYKHIIECCKSDGYEPKINSKVNDLDTYLLLVEANKGVSFVPSNNSFINNKNIVLLRVPDTHQKFEIAVGWKANQAHKIVQDFIKVTQSILKNFEWS